MKLFTVSGTLTVDMVVLAETQAEAEKIGRANWYEEMRGAGLEPEGFWAKEVTAASQVDSFLGVHYSPYGPEEKTYEHGASSPQLSLEEYLEQMGIK